MTRYNPPTKVVSAEIPFLALVVRDDASWARLKFNEVEYEFSGHNLRANPYQRGAYTGDLLTGGFSLHRLTSSLVAGPDGSLTATRLIENSEFNYHFQDKQCAKDAARLRFALYGEFKPFGRNLEIGFYNVGETQATSARFDLTNCSLASIIQYAGTDMNAGVIKTSHSSNGYCFVSFEVLSDSSATIIPYIQTIPLNLGSGNYQGDGSSGIAYANLHFHQLEA